MRFKEGEKVVVKLVSGESIIGELIGIDKLTNVYLRNAVEERKDGKKIRYGTVVIRGSNVVYIASAEEVTELVQTPNSNV